MNTTSEQSTTLIVLEVPIVSEATFDQKTRPSEEIHSTSLPRALSPHNKISKKNKNSNRIIILREVIHFDSNEEEELDLG